ncbi:hypothetical protein [Adhaeretor mobilis]|uniref:Uncharacterized protein n=1 Tax=Adhaeretor mobilis TaxID=1930276 RepID=A0A517MR42_9BACT|nr:hypothetical protein [Adhaeretor mobilis]QDS97341.1 hypothetical protein HG15A2_06020 [Adhaeretor mobilis]
MSELVSEYDADELKSTRPSGGYSVASMIITCGYYPGVLTFLHDGLRW